MRAVFVILMLLLSPALAKVPSDEDAGIHNKALALLYTRDFAGLNTLAQDYRVTDAKTAAGVPKLALFYSAFDGIALNGAGRPALLKSFETWQKANPSRTSVIALARLQLRYAWQLHGPKTPAPPDAQKKFAKYVQVAHQLLEANKPYGGTDPHWQWVMALVLQAEQPGALAPSEPLTMGQVTTDDSDEQSAEASIKFQASLLFEKGDFKGLNILAEFNRTHDARTPAGLNRLDYFYRGLDEYAQVKTPSLTSKPNQAAWKQVLDRAQAWIDQAPSPAAYVAMAGLRTSYAGAWRGTGYAHTIPPENIKPFHANLKLAHDVLSKSKAQASKDPEWYVRMIVLILVGAVPDNEAQTILTEGFKRYPTYYPLYAAMAYNLTPQWGGSWQAVEDFATYAAKITQGELGMVIYARIYQRVDCFCEEMTGSKRDWPKMRQGLKDIVARFPVNWNYNRAAYYACQAQDRQAARQALAKITAPRAEAWGGDTRLLPLCRSWAVSTG
ncbi:MAG: hypothetical protein ABI395_09890 [Sphingobium sp.]